MPVATDDTRHFESVVELTPEEARDNVDYFREQGLDAKYEGDGLEEEQPAEADKPSEEEPAAETPAATHADAGDADDDHDEDADAQSGKNDGEKLGWRAKKTKQIRDLEGKLQTTTAEKDGQIAELRRQLDAKDRSSSAPAATESSLAPTAVVQKEQPKAAEPPKPKEFDKARPVRPKFEDFASADDPIAAHADAVAEHADLLSDWKDEKRDFDSQQKAEQDRITQQTRTIQQEQEREITEKVTAARQAHSDFDAVTNGKFTPVLSYVLREAVPDGMEIGYLLAQSENAEALASLRKASQHTEGESQRSIERKIAQATFDVARIYQDLKGKTIAAPVTETEKPPVAEKPKQTPPVAAKPRSEAPAPVPVRSRGVGSSRLEDIPAEDYDARRKWRQENGEL